MQNRPISSLGKALKIILSSGAMFLLGAPAQAQSQQETIAFIIQEIRSFETETFSVRDAAFFEDARCFRLKTVIANQPERSLIIPLNNVDILVKQVGQASATRDYDLIVRSRGRNGRFRCNGQNLLGSEVMLPRTSDGRKLKRLEAAFTHLTGLVTERKPLFLPTVDPL